MTLGRKIFCAFLPVLVFCSRAPSDDANARKNAESVGKVLASLAAAYNARDPKAFAEQFTPKGEFVDADGDVFEGREAIAREFTALVDINPRNEIKLAAQEIREISPGILSVDSVATFSGAEESDTMT